MHRRPQLVHRKNSRHGSCSKKNKEDTNWEYRNSMHTTHASKLERQFLSANKLWWFHTMHYLTLLNRNSAGSQPLRWWCIEVQCTLDGRTGLKHPPGSDRPCFLIHWLPWGVCTRYRSRSVSTRPCSCLLWCSCLMRRAAQVWKIQTTIRRVPSNNWKLYQ